MDEDYIRALEYGMPPAAGEGIASTGSDAFYRFLLHSRRAPFPHSSRKEELKSV